MIGPLKRDRVLSGDKVSALYILFKQVVFSHEKTTAVTCVPRRQSAAGQYKPTSHLLSLSRWIL